MKNNKNFAALVLGIFLFFGLLGLGFFVGKSIVKYKLLDRSVTVKGLSEREYQADIVIWPIQFSVAANSLEDIYQMSEANSSKIKSFLVKQGIKPEEISLSSPAIYDKSANQYGYNDRPPFRYTANQIVTVYSKNVEAVRSKMGSLSELGKQGIAFSGENYNSQTEYLFTRLNEVKPEMIEEATNKAREVAEKFAEDSKSKLGKIKNASQGTFSIYSRDNNNPHIKKVRVVSTVQYYLSD